MDPKEYLVIRKAYNLMRQESGQADRLTFEELAILCVLYDKEYMNATQIADFQQVSRPTMTHRGNHLAKLGYINREPGNMDRRQVCCSNTEAGRTECETQLKMLLERLPESIARRMGRGKSAIENMRKQIVAMSGHEILAGSLTLFAFAATELNEEVTITRIVTLTGLLQPTVSMSVARLERSGLLERQRGSETSRRTTIVRVTKEGEQELRDMLEAVNGMKAVK